MAESDGCFIITKRSLKALLTIVIVTLLIAGGLISYILSLATYIAPSEDYPLYVQSAFTADQSGNPKTIFYRGQIVLVNVTIEMALEYYYNAETGYFKVPTRFLVLLQFIHDFEPVYLGFVVAELAPGESRSYGIGFRIPDTAALGDYAVKVMVWSNWLDKGGITLAYNSGLEVTFRVEG